MGLPRNIAYLTEKREPAQRGGRVRWHVAVGRYKGGQKDTPAFTPGAATSTVPCSHIGHKSAAPQQQHSSSTAVAGADILTLLSGR